MSSASEAEGKRSSAARSFHEAASEGVHATSDLDSALVVPDFYGAFVRASAGVVAKQHLLTDEGGVHLEGDAVEGHRAVALHAAALLGEKEVLRAYRAKSALHLPLPCGV